MVPPGVPPVVGLGAALALGITALALLVIDTVDPNDTRPTALAATAVTGSVVAAGVAGWLLAVGEGSVTTFDGALVVDGMALFFQSVFAFVTILVVIASYDYIRDRQYQAEYYALVLFAATGMSLMAAANSLAIAFVALELASLPSYALVGFLKRDTTGSVEGGLKYFLVGALSSAVFVFGISLIYAATGSLRLPDVFAAIAEPAAAVGGVEGVAGIVGVGTLMVAGGVAFKTASVPFHFWAPEAYEGAPAPVSAFISSASKAAGFALAFRVFATGFPLAGAGIDWLVLFQVLAVVTMTLGNFAAATQETVKRMLAYSSVGHAGYALIGLAAFSGGAVDAVPEGTVLGASMAHLLVYGFMNTGAFLFVALAEHWGVGRTFEDYAGLAKRAPIASLAMTVFMFSLAGLPPFGGFLSKYVLFLGAIDAGYWWLAAVGAVNSALSLFYYSRVVRALWIDTAEASFEIETTPTALYAAVVIAAVATLLLLPGFGPVVETAQQAAAGVVP